MTARLANIARIESALGLRAVSFLDDSPALIRCTVLVPTPRVVVIFISEGSRVCAAAGFLYPNSTVIH